MEASASARDRLLGAVIDHVSANGVGDRSLRQLAAALGTSHRMLIYHFGTKNDLLVEVVREVERRQYVAIAELTELHRADAGIGDLIRDVWRHLSEPELWPHIRLFFEVYGRTLAQQPDRSTFLDEVIDSWLGPLSELVDRQWLSEAEARARARLGIAAFRGLLLDLVTTGDRAGVDQAVECLARMYEAFDSVDV